MEEIRKRMMEIEDPRHQSYVKYALADILIIIMCGVLCGLDTLEDLVIYAKSAADFLRETFGMERDCVKRLYKSLQIKSQEEISKKREKGEIEKRV